jgi:hypothetical protein
VQLGARRQVTPLPEWYGTPSLDAEHPDGSLPSPPVTVTCHVKNVIGTVKAYASKKSRYMSCNRH